MGDVAETLRSTVNSNSLQVPRRQRRHVGFRALSQYCVTPADAALHLQSLHLENNSVSSATSFGGQLNLSRTGTTFQSEPHQPAKSYLLGADGSSAWWFRVGASLQSLKQKLRFGIWNWENSIHTRLLRRQCAPLPKLAVYPMCTFLFRVATLTLCSSASTVTTLHTVLRAAVVPTASFANQRENMVGNHPFWNAYLKYETQPRTLRLPYRMPTKAFLSAETLHFSMPSLPAEPGAAETGHTGD